DAVHGVGQAARDRLERLSIHFHVSARGKVVERTSLHPRKLHVPPAREGDATGVEIAEEELRLLRELVRLGNVDRNPSARLLSRQPGLAVVATHLLDFSLRSGRLAYLEEGGDVPRSRDRYEERVEVGAISLAHVGGPTRYPHALAGRALVVSHEIEDVVG